MSAKAPRIHTVLDPPLYRAVQLLARRNGTSLSQEVRHLVREALEHIEDSALDALAEERRRSFDRKKALSVKDIRKRLCAR